MLERVSERIKELDIKATHPAIHGFLREQIDNNRVAYRSKATPQQIGGLVDAIEMTKNPSVKINAEDKTEITQKVAKLEGALTRQESGLTPEQRHDRAMLALDDLAAEVKGIKLGQSSPKKEFKGVASKKREMGRITPRGDKIVFNRLKDRNPQPTLTRAAVTNDAVRRSNRVGFSRRVERDTAAAPSLTAASRAASAPSMGGRR